MAVEGRLHRARHFLHRPEDKRQVLGRRPSASKRRRAQVPRKRKERASAKRPESFSLAFKAPPGSPGRVREGGEAGRAPGEPAIPGGRRSGDGAPGQPAAGDPQEGGADEVPDDRNRVPRRARRSAGVPRRVRLHLALEIGWQRIAPWPKRMRVRVRMFAPSTVIPMAARRSVGEEVPRPWQRPAPARTSMRPAPARAAARSPGASRSPRPRGFSPASTAPQVKTRAAPEIGGAGDPRLRLLDPLERPIGTPNCRRTAA